MSNARVEQPGSLIYQNIATSRQPYYPFLSNNKYQERAVLISSQRPLLTYVFSAFTAAIANYIDDETFNIDTICELTSIGTSMTIMRTIDNNAPDPNALLGPNLQNKTLNDIVRRVEIHGLANSVGILTMLIISLTYHKKLPSEKLLSSLRELIDQGMNNCDWKRVSIGLGRSLLTLGNRGNMDRFTLRMAALCNELSEHVNEVRKLEAPAQESPTTHGSSMVENMILDYRNKNPQFEAAMAHVYTMRAAIPKRPTLVIKDVESLYSSADFYFENQTNALRWTEKTFRSLLRNALFTDPGTSRDMLGRTDLHYRAAMGLEVRPRYYPGAY